MESENNTSVNNTDNGTVDQAAPLKTSRWIGVAAIILFFVFGGWSACPWYLWIVFALLALFTFGGIYKGGQAVLGLVLLIWGTSLFGGGDDDYEYNQASSSTYNSSSSQSESERRDIEAKIRQIESLQAQFDRAVNIGAPEFEQKRISDQAWNIYQNLQKKNLTPEQRNKLSRMFEL
ncbi:MAG: hypothetical protein K2H71_02750 [Muribaculaceae bacterium]|nr:hypothetical protein [Muribaculaceae bacterium]